MILSTVTGTSGWGSAAPAIVTAFLLVGAVSLGLAIRRLWKRRDLSAWLLVGCFALVLALGLAFELGPTTAHNTHHPVLVSQPNR